MREGGGWGEGVGEGGGACGGIGVGGCGGGGGIIADSVFWHITFSNATFYVNNAVCGRKAAELHHVTLYDMLAGE